MNRFCRLLVLALCLSVSAMVSAAEYDFTSDGIYYKVLSLDEMTVGVTKGDKNYTGDVVIPETISYNGRTFTVSQILESSFESSKANSVKLPKTIALIGRFAFRSSKLTGIELPTEQPLRIMDYAFYSSALESIVVPDNVIELGKQVFQQCYSMVSAEIGEGVSAIPEYAFAGNAKLEKIKLGSNIKAIGQVAFSGCSRLSEIYLPEGLKSIGHSAFHDCVMLTDIKIPSGIEVIESSTFSGCERLTDVTIPDNVRSVKYNVFEGCTRLKTVTFGSKVETIEVSCFKDCPALTEIGIRNPEPPACKAFTNKQYMDIALKVPQGAVDIYKKTEPWKNFWTIEAIGTSGATVVAADSNVSVRHGEICVTAEAADKGVQIYDTLGKCVYDGHDTIISGLSSGIYIVKTRDSSLKIRL